MLAGFGGPVLLLEEDHAVLPDVLTVLHKASALMDANCPDCTFLTLGDDILSPLKTHNRNVSGGGRQRGGDCWAMEQRAAQHGDGRPKVTFL